ncbi:hypothetical protein G7Y89_g9964 [Cudoniella acicularis]|uniref:Cytochrome P450 n=1 Tax=Cudoniella acicularis TaxID=354080 RepID=A0A8H4RFW9_9HELO|nr:hypothetical protein G7Y89_g9964 [Cudoniella acicularis]
MFSIEKAEEINDFSNISDNFRSLKMPSLIARFPKLLWLFSKSDISTFVVPDTAFGIFGALSGTLLTTNSSPDLISTLLRTPLVAGFIWFNVLVFELANQRLPESIIEDRLNKPWRPLPNGLITPVQTRRFLLAVLPIFLGISVGMGVWRETSILFTLTYMYNDLKGGDEDFIVRNLIIAAAFGVYNEGALRIASGPGHAPTTLGFTWTAIVSCIIFSTMHVQDMQDQEGDLAKGRRSAPIVLGDWVARWTVAIPVTFWSVFCPLYWDTSILGWVLPIVVGSIIAVRELWLREPEADHTTWTNNLPVDRSGMWSSLLHFCASPACRSPNGRNQIDAMLPMHHDEHASPIPAAHNEYSSAFIKARDRACFPESLLPHFINRILSLNSRNTSGKMALFESQHLTYAEELQKLTLAVTLMFISLFSSVIYVAILDFSKTYVVPPKHFPKRSWKTVFFKPKIDAPLVEPKPGSNDFKEVLERGSRLYPDRPYRIPHHPYEWVIVPYKMIDEIRNIPESKLSFQQGSYDFFMGWHTGVTNHERTVANILKTGVNRIIDVVYGVVQDESYRTVLENIGDCPDWTTIQLLPRTVSMIMAISQRVFVGDPLCRDPEWLYCIYQVTQNAFGSVPSLWKYNWFTRPLAAWRHPALKSVRSHREKAKRMLKPVLEKRLKDMEDSDFKPAPDLMQFVLDATQKTGEGRSLDYQVNAIIGTGRAALFTTGLTIYQLAYDLATHPEYIEPLREEFLELGDVPLTRANVNKLVKLDSFVRESQRHSKFMLVGTFRKVMKDITLSDGTRLPAGAYVGTNVQDAVFNNSTLEDPYKFDGFRFAKLRAQGKGQMYQSVQTAADHLVYGHGNQACPGRFFAAHEAKVVTSRILMNYDFKIKNMPDAHPFSHVKGIMTEANPSVEFEFKKREWAYP